MFSYKRAFEYLCKNPLLFVDSSVKHLGFLFPDKLYLSIRYRCRMGSWIDWNNPKTFTEKIQWLKVYGYRPEYTTLVDKLSAKEYVAHLIGEQYIIPTLAVWDNVQDIDWDVLPNQFVLKTTHGGGSTGVVICREKSNFNRSKAMKKLESSMRSVVGKEFRERPYYNVPKKIIAESYISNDNSNGNVIEEDLVDFKFYCFNGVPHYCQVIRGRNSKETIDFYNMEWERMPFIGLNPKASQGDNEVPKPTNLEKAIEICKKLSSDLPFARVDLYIVGSHIFFGEITLYPGGGIGAFSPANWNLKLGDLLDLKNKLK